MRIAEEQRLIDDLPSRDAIHSHLRAMMTSEGWRILVMHFNAEREKIIATGKKGRSDEKGQKMWAALDGFDRAALLAERLAKITEPRDQRELPPLEES